MKCWHMLLSRAARVHVRADAPVNIEAMVSTLNMLHSSTAFARAETRSKGGAVSCSVGRHVNLLRHAGQEFTA